MSNGSQALRFTVLDDSIIRVTYTTRDDFRNRESLIVQPWSGKTPSWSWTDGSDQCTLATAAIQVAVRCVDGRIVFSDSSGNPLMAEAEKNGRTLTDVEVRLSSFDDATAIATERGVDGVTERAGEVKKYVDRTAYQARLALSLSENEAIYGLGSHEEGFFSYRGKKQYLYQQNMKVTIPVMVSTKGYGVLFDTYAPLTFDDTGSTTVIDLDTLSELDYYFLYGPEFDDIVGLYRRLTGPVPLLPRWAFGYVQSKERYVTQQELIDIVREYRRRNIPLDCVVLDWRSWVGELWGQKTLDPERFPDPKAMMHKIHELGAHLMISIWPHMRNNGSNQIEMMENGMLLGNRSTYNAFDKSARELYWKHANDGLFAHGIDAWWCDCTEPFEADWRGEIKLDLQTRMQINTDEQKKYLDPEYISAYSLLHSEGIYAGQRATTSHKRVVNLTRSGYAGQQRYGTITWSGDICAKWEVLRRQIPEGLNFCASGLPYWTVDIGAFFVDRKEQWFWDGDYPGGCDDEGYRELYVRWFQYATFLPMFRSHGTDTPREVWRFGEPGSITYDTLVKFDNLRYRLIPYIYSQAWRITSSGGTLMKMLAFDFREDENVYDIDDQYMFGPSILVCPVTESMTSLNKGNRTRSVYLPGECGWYDFWTGSRLGGGSTIAADAPLDRMPLYVREGSIITMGPVVQHTGHGLTGPIEVRVYPGADAACILYDDAGDGYGYESGECCEMLLTWNDSEKALSISDRRGKYPGMPDSLEFDIVVVDVDHGVGVEQSTAGDATITYTGAESRVVVP